MKNFWMTCVEYFPFSLYYAKCQLRKEVAIMRLGWIWWFLEPALFTAIYVFVFSFVFRSRLLYRVPYVALGQMMWSFFNRTCTNSVTLIRHYRGLLSRSDIPKFVLLINSMLVSGFKMFISFLLVVGLMYFYKVPVTRMYALFPLILSVFIVFCFGCGLWLMHLGVYFPDLKNVVPVLLRMLLYLSGIFYSLEDRLGELAARIILRYNPVGCLMFEARNVLLYNRLTSPYSIAIWFGVGLLLSATALKSIERHEKDYIKVI